MITDTNQLIEHAQSSAPDAIEAVIMQIEALSVQLREAMNTRIVTCDSAILARDINTEVQKLWKKSQ